MNRNKMNKRMIRPSVTFLFYSLIFLAIYAISNLTPIERYIETLKGQSIAVQGEEHETLEKIKQLALEINQEPINAQIDRVWQAIPGLNGIKVNVHKSLELTRQLGFLGAETIVIEEVKPEINLEDLPVHPIYRGNPHKPMVSLMVNVAWGTEYLEQMLAIFAENQIKVTFFLDGTWLKNHPTVAQQLLDAGHEIGNHAYSHPNDMKKLSAAQIREEITKTEDLIKQLGVQSAYFAPPAGAFDQRVVEIADQLGMRTVLWTLDTVDWQKPSPSTIVKRIVPNLHQGALILMHPTQSTVEALPQLIEGARQKGLMMGSVADLLSSQRTFSIVRLD